MNYNLAKFVASYPTASQLPEHRLPEVAFAGRSNVGKSSLMNKIFNRKNLVKVSSTPGKTQSVNFFEADGVSFVDLPGYGFAKRSRGDLERWNRLMAGYFETERPIALTLVLVDIRHDASPLDAQMLEYVDDLGLPLAVVFTKADKLSRPKQRQMVAKLRQQLEIDDVVPCVLTSSADGTGIDEVRKMIALAAGK